MLWVYEIQRNKKRSFQFRLNRFYFLCLHSLSLGDIGTVLKKCQKPVSCFGESFFFPSNSSLLRAQLYFILLYFFEALFRRVARDTSEKHTKIFHMLSGWFLSVDFHPMSNGISNLISHRARTSSSGIGVGPMSFLTSARCDMQCVRWMKKGKHATSMNFRLLWAHQHHHHHRRGINRLSHALTLSLCYLKHFFCLWVIAIFNITHIAAHIHKHDGWKVRRCFIIAVKKNEFFHFKSATHYQPELEYNIFQVH